MELPVKRIPTLLIADRNSHVREFLKREMSAAGYRVHLAENGNRVLKWIYCQEPIDLLILDPDLPGAEESSLLNKLHDRIPTLPVILHTFLSDYDKASALLNAEAFVEKEGMSVERLKQVVTNILEKVKI